MPTLSLADGSVVTATLSPNPPETGGGGGQKVSGIAGAVVGDIAVLVLMLLAAAYWLYGRKVRLLRAIAGRIAGDHVQNGPIVAEALPLASHFWRLLTYISECQ